MIGKKVSAENNSIAVGGNNTGMLINVGPGGNLYLNAPPETGRKLGTLLGTIISVIAQQSLSEYGHSYQRTVPPEVQDKLDFNHITVEDRLIGIYRKYYFMLDRAYQGVEQTNNDARVLVRLRAGSIYSAELTKACAEKDIPCDERIEYSRTHAHALIESVKKQLVQDVFGPDSASVDPAQLDLAISLVVADAVAECDVLEKAQNVTAA